MSLSHSLPFNRLRHGPGEPYPPISSLIQTPMDPAAVDFRAFYPYTPNEVKHRKRTTSAQLKILEGIFKRDTKPNASLRNELAAQLDMTARGVQVWFQNRRAKEKTKAAKSKRGEQDSSPSLDGAGDGQQDQRDDQADSSSQESSPTRVSPPQLHVVTDSDSSSWNNSPAATPDDHHGVTPFSDHHFLRRGSLPAGELFPADSAICPPLIGHLDPFARRRSVDASLHRLAANPYAHLARAKNGIPHGSRISRARLPYHRPSYVPELQHTASIPYGTFHTRHSSMDSRSFRFSPTAINSSSSPSHVAAYTTRASLPDSNLFSFSSRSTGSLIPGPLPSPDFTFGAASTNSSSLTSPCSADSDRSSPEPFRDMGAYCSAEFDKGSEHILPSYDTYPRFGSVASTTTDSSFYSDNVVCKPEDENVDLSRRDSCSGQFVGLIANLDVNGFETAFTNGGYSPPEDILPQDGDPAGAYPSPSSTVSGAQPDVVAVSHSSELAFALQSQPPQVPKNGNLSYTPPLEESHIDNTTSIDQAPFFYTPPNSYTQSPAPPTSFDANEQQISTSSENFNIYSSSGDMFSLENHNANHDTNLDFGHPQDVYSSFSIETPNNAAYAVSYT